MVVCFVDIGEIFDPHTLNFLLFVDIGGIIDQQALNFLLFFDIGGLVDHQALTFLHKSKLFGGFFSSVF